MRSKYLLRLLLLGLWLAIPLFFIVVPTAFLEAGYSICLFKNMFGLNCPGCGMTRAISFVFHADFVGAFYHNKSVVVVFPLVCFIYIQQFAALYRKRTL